MELVISTATAACSVALISGDAIHAEIHEVVSRGHAERLVPMIAALPGNGRADAIIVDCGPGSFTGVRVGVAAAKALSLAWGIPLHGCSTLALIAAGFEDDADGTLCVATEGGHGELFVQRFGRAPLRALDGIVSLRPEDAGATTPDRLVLGSGAERLVAARGDGQAIDRLPRAADARHLPKTMRQLAPSPIYVRAPDARPQ